MPLINTTYTKVASYTPFDATGVSYFWLVDGTIISGQSTNTVNYQFNATGTRTVTLTVFNTCSSQDFTQSFVVCEPITGLSIVPQTAPNTAGDTYIFDATSTSGNNLTYTWSITGSSTISSGQGTSQVSVVAEAGSSVLTVTTTDCDGNTYTANYTIDISITPPPLCVPITGCSF
jgi:hypothetical protein